MDGTLGQHHDIIGMDGCHGILGFMDGSWVGWLYGLGLKTEVDGRMVDGGRQSVDEKRSTVPFFCFQSGCSDACWRKLFCSLCSMNC